MAICVFNRYNNTKAYNDGWLPLPGVSEDERVIREMLRTDYVMEILTNQEDISSSIIDLKLKWKDQNIGRLHFHFSGHGIINQTIDAVKMDPNVNVFTSNTPFGHCLVGDDGDCHLTSVLDIKHHLNEFNSESITITLDCCRDLDRPRQKVELAKQPTIGPESWYKMATFYATCETIPSRDRFSLSQALYQVHKKRNKCIPILEMDKEVNDYWKANMELQKRIAKGTVKKQYCMRELVQEGDNWKCETWPV